MTTTGMRISLPDFQGAVTQLENAYDRWVDAERDIVKMLEATKVDIRLLQADLKTAHNIVKGYDGWTDRNDTIREDGTRVSKDHLASITFDMRSGGLYP